MVEDSAMTSSCRRCGRSMNMSRMTKLAKGEDLEDARAKLNALTEGRQPCQPATSEKAAGRPARSMSQKEALVHCMSELTDSRGTFLPEELSQSLSMEGVELAPGKLSDVLDSFLQQGRVMEPEPGRYAWVG